MTKKKEKLIPKFLTKELLESTVKSVLETIFKTTIGNKLKRHACHIVVLVPSMDGNGTWPNYQIKPHVLFQISCEKTSWSREYDEIAQCKALQLWHGRNDDGLTDIRPHLLMSGDTPFWGGVKRHGIVVSCSGFQPHFDQMISGMIADIIKGLAYEAWLNSTDKTLGVNFLDRY